MTPAELRALDAQVARDVLGLLICDSPGSLELPARCSLFGVAHYSADLSNSDSGDELPRYSTDIAAAWPLVEHMLDGRAFGVWVSVTHEAGWYAIVDVDGAKLCAEGDTAPLAICRAALLYAGGPGQLRVTRPSDADALPCPHGFSMWCFRCGPITPKKYGTAYGTETQSNPIERP